MQRLYTARGAVVPRDSHYCHRALGWTAPSSSPAESPFTLQQSPSWTQTSEWERLCLRHVLGFP